VKDLDDGPWKTRIAEPLPSQGYLCWHGDDLRVFDSHE
jgi:hypothetical protein